MSWSAKSEKTSTSREVVAALVRGTSDVLKRAWGPRRHGYTSSEFLSLLEDEIASWSVLGDAIEEAGLQWSDLYSGPYLGISSLWLLDCMQDQPEDQVYVSRLRAQSFFSSEPY